VGTHHLTASWAIDGRALEEISGLAFTYAPDGTTARVNQRLLQYLGRPLKELQAWAFNDTMHPDDLDRVTREWRANIAAGRAYVMEHRLRRADGVYRWVRVSVAPRRTASGQLEGWCGVVLDIDEEKRSDEKPPDEEQALQRLIDSLPGLAYTMTPACEIELVNRRVCEYFGRCFEGLRNWDRIECVHPVDLPRVRDSLARTAEFGAPYEIEQRLRRWDGEYRWFKSRALPARGPYGQIVRWYVLLGDIDEVKRAEEALRRAGV
jgi:PAS domain S-box-containing protein